MKIPKADVVAYLNRLRDEIRAKRKFGVSLIDMDDIRAELEDAVLHIGERDLRACAETIKEKPSRPSPCLSLYLAGQPVAKGRVRFTVKGKPYTPQKTLHYEGRLVAAAQEAMNGRPPFAGPLRVLVEARMAIAQSWPKKKHAAALAGVLRPTGRPDCDNLAKTLDGLGKIVWNDDGQVVDLHIYKHYSVSPALVVQVFEVSDFFA